MSEAGTDNAANMARAEGPAFGDMGLSAFVEVLAARQPVPGGGGAAAYTGALAAALCSMAGEYAAGRPGPGTSGEELEDLLARAKAVRERLVGLVDEDASAFLAFSRALSLPKTDPARPQALEAAKVEASTPPIRMMEQCCLAIGLLEEMEQKGARGLVSDVGCGALLARAALEAASFNVYANTRSMKDGARAQDLEAHANDMLDTYVPRASALAQRCLERVKGRG